jgi:hypothetical protein
LITHWEKTCSSFMLCCWIGNVKRLRLVGRGRARPRRRQQPELGAAPCASPWWPAGVADRPFSR